MNSLPIVHYLQRTSNSTFEAAKKICVFELESSLTKSGLLGLIVCPALMIHLSVRLALLRKTKSINFSPFQIINETFFTFNYPAYCLDRASADGQCAGPKYRRAGVCCGGRHPDRQWPDSVPPNHFLSKQHGQPKRQHLCSFCPSWFAIQGNFYVEQSAVCVKYC